LVSVSANQLSHSFTRIRPERLAAVYRGSDRRPWLSQEDEPKPETICPPGREEFRKRVWQWKEKHGGIIIKQLKKLGCSCDWTHQWGTVGVSENIIAANLEALVDSLDYALLRK
jgi:hypothetical protein